jgi:hypothetical protein
MIRLDQDGSALYLQSHESVQQTETCRSEFQPACALDRFEEIELKSQSRSPVSQAVASSWTTAWHPFRS